MQIEENKAAPAPDPKGARECWVRFLGNDLAAEYHWASMRKEDLPKDRNGEWVRVREVPPTETPGTATPPSREPKNCLICKIPLNPNAGWSTCLAHRHGTDMAPAAKPSDPLTPKGGEA